jgi:cyclic beta-1,2-glucan synthetase
MRAREMADAMDFRILFDRKRKLFAIGLRVADNVLDAGLYDLLASEARLTSFIAIAKGDVPVSQWFHLGRALTPVGRDSVLVSWSGSMFEYLMPLLIMRAPEGSLLDQTCRLVVQRQIDYGTERDVPWGISESGYNVRDIEMTYQYSTFGIPGLGLRRQSGDDLVIAPYATGLAAMVDPSAAARNFARLAAAGAAGRYGFHEALDYTPARVPTGARVAIVRSYMAHHQGMTLIALADSLLGEPMPRRFHGEPVVRAAELLLQERTPRDVAVARPQVDEAPIIRDAREPVLPKARRFLSPHSAVPRTHLLSNGRYTVMLTTAGSGYSRWNDLAVTRWREDATSDPAGTHIFLRDMSTDDIWSAGYQPTTIEPDNYSVAFSEDRAEFTRRDGGVATRLEVVVSPEADAELRRITVTNHSLRTRDIELTSYAEVVIAPHAADVAHPAFSNLFVRTELLADRAALLATRRPRSSNEAEVWLAHVLSVDGDVVDDLQWETDRAKFVGRDRRVGTATVILDGTALSNSTGAVLDPIMSLRRRVRLRPGGRARLTFSTMAAASREAVVELVDHFRDASAFERAADLAWTQAQVQLHHLDVTVDEAHLFQTLASAAIYANPSLRPPGSILAQPTGGRAALWAHGISGDLPIVLVQIDDTDGITLVRQLLRAHAYWRAKRFPIDLVILNEHGLSYQQDLQLQLETLARASQPTAPPEGSESVAKIFVLRADRIAADRSALLIASRAVLSDRRGTLAEQVTRSQRQPAESPYPAEPAAIAQHHGALPPPPELAFFNGLGGFSADGREYVVSLSERNATPAPWINVISNPTFGFQCSASGSGYTWSVNSRENQLTVWSNDPVSDPPGEALYLRDLDSGAVWTPTALPIRLPSRRYITRHGQGYTRYEHDSHGIGLELLQFVPVRESVKISRLTITNRSRQARRLSLTSYTEWVLDVSRGTSAQFIVTEVDPATGALFATNCWNTDFRDRVAFVDLAGAQTSWTADRSEFLGRNGDLARPAALLRDDKLSGRTGAGMDPCAALQTTIDLAPGASRTVTVLLGQAGNRAEASSLVTQFRAADYDALLNEVHAQWEQLLGAVQVETPDPAMDLMLNRWLLYQTVSCRLWARSAFYQASGAYGFRDQLQDVMAVAVARPDLTRDQILRAAARQFPEGDVQHWWHATTGRGLRTRMSDDLLWLPYVTAHYLRVTGDTSILDEPVTLLEGARLQPDEQESYYEPRVADERPSLHEHCLRAIEHSLSTGNGVHGLPLMGSGDWNDGMNRVGYLGKGESVWLGWFLCTVLREWSPIAKSRGESERTASWETHVLELARALERDGWDGAWYRRAYYDDGTPLGSASNEECRIDAIAQSWSVLSGVGDDTRSRQAMRSLDSDLVRRDDRIQLLLTPPFDKAAQDPGYIKGYLPGIRENGGQYSHAATWTIMAYAQLGDGAKASEIFGFLNPVSRALTPADVARYRVEPYVVVGDVYSVAPNNGHGGWTWYTGTAGWLYRAGIESILGFRLRGKRLLIEPCIPASWTGFKLRFQHGATQYQITVENPDKKNCGVSHVEVDGQAVDIATGIELAEDGKVHAVRVVIGGAPKTAEAGSGDSVSS